MRVCWIKTTCNYHMVQRKTTTQTNKGIISLCSQFHVLFVFLFPFYSLVTKWKTIYYKYITCKLKKNFWFYGSSCSFNYCCTIQFNHAHSDVLVVGISTCYRSIDNVGVHVEVSNIYRQKHRSIMHSA